MGSANRRTALSLPLPPSLAVIASDPLRRTIDPSVSIPKKARQHPALYNAICAIKKMLDLGYASFGSLTVKGMEIRVLLADPIFTIEVDQDSLDLTVHVKDGKLSFELDYDYDSASILDYTFRTEPQSYTHLKQLMPSRVDIDMSAVEAV